MTCDPAVLGAAAPSGRRGNRGGAATVTETVDYAAVWSAATDLLNDEIVSQQQRAYLRLTQLRAIVDDTALLAVPDAFTRDVIESQLRPAITEALSRHLGRPIQVAVTVRPPEDGARNALTAPTAAVAIVPVPKPKPHVPISREPGETPSPTLRRTRPRSAPHRRRRHRRAVRAGPMSDGSARRRLTSGCTTATTGRARPATAATG